MAYTISNLSEEHCAVLVRALDLYSRIPMGQFRELVRVWNDNKPKDSPVLSSAQDNEVRVMLELTHDVLTGLPRGTYRGIYDRNLPESVRLAWDLQQVVRHRLAWDRKPEGDPLLVDFDAPRKSAEQELPTMVKEG